MLYRKIENTIKSHLKPVSNKIIVVDAKRGKKDYIHTDLIYNVCLT